MATNTLPYGSNITVRADFYPTGQILPLGITDKNGNTFYIDQTMKTEICRDGNNGVVTRFTCVCGTEKCWLTFDGRRWELKKTKERRSIV